MRKTGRVWPRIGFIADILFFLRVVVDQFICFKESLVHKVPIMHEKKTLTTFGHLYSGLHYISIGGYFSSLNTWPLRYMARTLPIGPYNVLSPHAQVNFLNNRAANARNAPHPQPSYAVFVHFFNVMTSSVHKASPYPSIHTLREIWCAKL